MQIVAKAESGVEPALRRVCFSDVLPDVRRQEKGA